MIIDFHTHLGNSYDGSKQNIRKLKNNMKKYGISKCVVFPIDDKNFTVEEYSYEILRNIKNDKSLIPFFRFDPKKMTADKLEKILKDFYGVKLHSRAENFDPLDKKYFKLYKVIEESGKPLIFHVKKYMVKQTDPLMIVKLAKHFPRLKLVLAHFGSSQPSVFQYVKKNKLKNVYFETSVASTQFYIAKKAEMIGFDRILLGSDCPYSDQEVELLKIKKMQISSENKKKILGLNAKKLLGI